MSHSAGSRFDQALKAEKPLQIVGTINAYSARLAAQAGFRALYLSGAGVANASWGLPDLALTNLADVLEDARRILSVTDLPLLVDIDTGWGHAFTIARAVKALCSAGVAGIHLEDQIDAKRCGHRPGKSLVSIDEMTDRLKAATDAREDPTFKIMARTDALANEGEGQTLERIKRYVEAGADCIFLEGATKLETYRTIKAGIAVPLLANMTEFGVTPLATTQELAAVGVDMVLYPLSAFRAMNLAALKVYTTIRQAGSQHSCLADMQTRDQLYQSLDYLRFEQSLDRLQK